MRLGLQWAARAQGRTRPNPMVGAVVVSKGKRVGIGFHRRAGRPHAEIEALRQAGKKARGATLYVTLEPCRHFGRTPPCLKEILSSGVRRVVIAMEDPSPKMRGRSLAQLRAAGVSVTAGILQEEARRLNEVYLTWRQAGRPFVTVKVAHSLDGKIATSKGESRWISSPKARRYAHALRAQVDAIAVGARTVLRDNPRLTCRGYTPVRPLLKVVLDSQALTHPASRLFQEKANVLIATTGKAPLRRRRLLEKRGAQVIVFPEKNGKVSFSSLLKYLARQEITHLLIEGGGELVASALEARAVDRWISIVAPVLIGGRDAPTAFDGKGIASLQRKISLQVQRQRRLGGDRIFECKVKF